MIPLNQREKFLGHIGFVNERPRVNSRMKKVFASIFENPIRSDVAWKDIEKLCSHLGAIIQEGAGSRVLIKFENQKAVFHRPHPKRVTDKGALKAVRRFLIQAGYEYDEI